MSLAPLTQAQQSLLFQLARESIIHFLSYRKILASGIVDARLNIEQGAFVTLKKDGTLRGCIGQITPDGPLYKIVQSMAISAATKDPRFPPVTTQELKSLDIEISLLSPPLNVKDPKHIQVGKHGVIVRGYGKVGIFLPKVATEAGWDLETLLNNLCTKKAGLAEDAWKNDPNVSLYAFEADVYSRPLIS